jgi:hypothetical protein
MVKFLVIGLVAVVLLGGAFGGLTILGIVPDVLGVRAMVAEPLGLAVESEEGGAAAPPARDFGPVPVFMPMPQLAIPVIVNGRTESQLMLSLRLNIAPGASAQVTRAMPRLQDALVTGLIDALPRLRTRSGRVDLAALKARVNAIARQQIGGDVVYDVLIDIAYSR